jgi:hypothetical protein
MQNEIIQYNGWEGCLRLSNSQVELVITTEVGPRIIRYGLHGEANIFGEFPEQAGLQGGDEWRIYGGHRFWHAPEGIPRTYVPDNFPIQHAFIDDFVRLIQPVETTTGIEKEMDIRLADHSTQVQVTHRLRNRGLWAVELAPWALSVMAAGGTAILPLPPRGSHDENLLPANTLTLWAYTDLSDPRFTLSGRFILLRQDPARETPQKIGAQVQAGWAAYALGGQLFFKRFNYQPGAVYPDGGCSVELYTDQRIIEVETLGPLVRLEPGSTVEHIETWHLLGEIPPPENEADVLQYVLPVVSDL